MNVYDLSANNSVLHQYMKELRSVEIQGDSMRFRRNIARIANIMAYEISKHCAYQVEDVVTPLGVAPIPIATNRVVLGTILRAGLPFHQGFLDVFDRAENAFVSAYRKYIDAVNFDIHIEYIASPDLNEKTLILSDPMLATGGSMELAYKALLTKGRPAHTHLVALVASRQAVDYIQSHITDDNVTLWVASVDDVLNEHSYIVPGLGDAGDLAFGEKL